MATTTAATTADSGVSTLVLVICSILLPPLAVFLKRGLGVQFVINLVLTIVGFWILGIIHALFITLA